MQTASGVGDVRVSESGGDVRVSESGGDVRVSESGGDVRVSESGGGGGHCDSNILSRLLDIIFCKSLFYNIKYQTMRVLTV
jgi:hypothetical protein